ncbi:MAG: hypothetical protein ABEI86_01970 [Halobacteriaceae archaeon]
MEEKDTEEKIEELEDKIEDMESDIRELKNENPEIAVGFGSMFSGSVQTHIEGTNGESSEDLAEILTEMLPDVVDQAERIDDEDEEDSPVAFQ